MSQYEFKLPDLGEGTVEAEIAEWMVKPGDQIEEEQPFCAMLTDKAAVELSAPVSGTVVSVAGEEGDMVSVGATLIVFETEAGVEISVTAPEPEAEAKKDTASLPTARAATAISAELPEPVSGRDKVATSPSIRRRAKAEGIDLTQVPGSGPRGRILNADFEAWLSRSPSGEAATSGEGIQHRRASRTITEIKVKGLRRIIAERMAQANREIPHFAYVEEIDVTALESLRVHLNSRADADGRLTPLPFIALALVRALDEFPQCNALYDAERNVIQQYGAVHLGIATQTSDGLKVPVVKHAEARSLADLAAEIRRVAEAARDNSATREELGGSTITITSLGKMGGIVTTPIINSPEVGIIGVGKAVDRPVVVDGQVVIRRMMNLSSSFDHRFVDGYDAAQMIQTVKGYLEQPATLFIDF